MTSAFILNVTIYSASGCLVSIEFTDDSKRTHSVNAENMNNNKNSTKIHCHAAIIQCTENGSINCQSVCVCICERKNESGEDCWLCVCA